MESSVIRCSRDLGRVERIQIIIIYVRECGVHAYINEYRVCVRANRDILLIVSGGIEIISIICYHISILPNHGYGSKGRVTWYINSYHALYIHVYMFIYYTLSNNKIQLTHIEYSF